MATKTPDNRKASPMVHESIIMPNLKTQRAQLAREADTLTRDQLQARAAELQVPLEPHLSKDAMVEAVNEAVNPAAEG